jgi:hypothetical protein
LLLTSHQRYVGATKQLPSRFLSIFLSFWLTSLPPFVCSCPSKETLDFFQLGKRTHRNLKCWSGIKQWRVKMI